MNKPKNTADLEWVVSSVLRIGVIISVSFILAGLVLFFSGSHHFGNYHQFSSASYSFPHTINSLINAMLNGRSAGYIEFGILLLILTPILRVASSTMLFSRKGERPMMLVTLFVLIILIGSFILGLSVR